MSKPLSALPHPAGRIPILGDVRSVDRRRPTQHETDLVRELGPIYQRELLGDRLVIVGGAELASQTLNEDNWGRALVGPGAKLRDIVPRGLFTARSSDPLWGQARRILTPGFSQAAMQTYHDAMTSVADDLTHKWQQENPVDVHRDMTAATLEVIGRAGFSTRMGLLGPAEGDHQADTRRFVDALDRVLVWAGESTNDVPVLGTIRGLLSARNRSAAVEFAQKYVDDIIAARVGETGDNEFHDLLDLMLTAVDSETGLRLPHENARDQVLTFLVAGHETTAALMEVALYYLATDPEAAQALSEAARTPETLDYAAVSGLRDIREFLNECLRLWPPLPGFFRVARTDQDLGGYRVPAGRAVFVLALAAQRDPAVWGDGGDEFRADRFLTTRRTKSSGLFFAPWGAGPRSCIGRQFALHEATILVASILRGFDLAPHGMNADLRMRERGTLRPEPFSLQVTPR